MNQNQFAAWKNDALDVVFEALAARDSLTACVVFKGARILSRLLADDARQSLDIDMNMTAEFVARYPSRVEQRTVFETEISEALIEHTSRADTVRYELRRVSVGVRDDHPMGWNGFVGHIELRDLTKPNYRGLPTLEVDIAAPEALGVRATAPLRVGVHDVSAYTEARIAGEKLRAFLSTLSAYRTKMHSKPVAVRVKDLYDLARIERLHSLADSASAMFWTDVANEFTLACESRFVDCVGLATFEEALAGTRSAYTSDPTIPSDIPIEVAWPTLERIVARLSARGTFPLRFPLPIAP